MPVTDPPPGAGPRRAARLAAFLTALLIAAHLVFLFELGGDSPLWPTLMLDLQDALDMPVAVANGMVGLAFALVGLLLVIAIWLACSRLAALLLIAAAGWEAFAQGRALWRLIDTGGIVPPFARLSAAFVVLALLLGLVALFAGFAYGRARRGAREGTSTGLRAEKMALKIRARR
ncbi:MAG: hypothetical protein HKM95_08830 [Inquilinus sp.]|nr:hypothetical protein [Inquilinus sp.]